MPSAEIEDADLSKCCTRWPSSKAKHSRSLSERLGGRVLGRSGRSTDEGVMGNA